MFCPKLVALALYALPALAAPSPLLRISRAQNPLPGKYIVTLKQGQGAPDTISVESVSSNMSPASNITHQWENMGAFAGDLSADDLETLRADPRVEAIEEDGIMQTLASVTQTNAPWGLSRISSQTKLADQDDASLNFTYTFDSTSGAGSTVYIIDTGIFIQHPEFQGRARFGATFVGNLKQDGNGHGTHVAGTAVSSQFGVAKGADVVAVKVLGDDGSGQNSNIISGLNFVATDFQRTGTPTVASLSLGGGASNAVDTAVIRLFNFGVPVVVAAGNDNQDAVNSSPARVQQAITVAASTIDDTKASFSNFGAGVDVWAPGLNVISTSNDGSTRVLSGTSMATPHVSGLVAYLLGLDSSLSPTQVEATIKSQALNNVLSGVPRGTPNILINNAF
ncbi:serine protease [Thelephora terrestris]|uniref:Serine protease n=1 Tax=Thelephora terrestris TaxID=56493 RepID=A0A9P6HP66_9AGAM|nr:serine protease [Thelephora terrestris]